MAEGTKAYIEDRDGNKILPATDWSIIQNKPTNWHEQINYHR